MEKDVLEKYKMNSRAEAVAFLNSDWKCTGCGERYDAMKLLNLLNEGFGR